MRLLRSNYFKITKFQTFLWKLLPTLPPKRPWPRKEVHVTKHECAAGFHVQGGFQLRETMESMRPVLSVSAFIQLGCLQIQPLCPSHHTSTAKFSVAIPMLLKIDFHSLSCLGSISLSSFYLFISTPAGFFKTPLHFIDSNAVCLLLLLQNIINNNLHLFSS